MFNDNLAHVIEFENFNLVEIDNELVGNVSRETFCPMCDEYHVNNTYCQYPLQEAV